jgi:hypothetical protein
MHQQMRRIVVASAVLCAAAPVALAQGRAQLAEGYIVTLEVRALATDVKLAKGAGEARAVVSSLKPDTPVVGRFYLAQDISRMEVVSTDFVLPAGTLVLHKAGDKFYVIADPKSKTYVPMDSEGLLNALEGGAGIVNSQYTAKVTHTPERKEIAGAPCRKSIVTITYASLIPFENDRILIQQKNDIEVWHTSQLVSAAAMDHFFFRFHQDKTGATQKVLSSELGFPMEVNLVVTNVAEGKKASAVQPGSLHATVTDVKLSKKLPAELFQIPPEGYARVDRNPFTRR